MRYCQTSEYKREYYLKNKIHLTECIKKLRDIRRRFIINYYTDGKNCCACCGEKEFKFLTIDHINNDGGKHRKIIRGGGTAIYKWLRRNYFPDGFQILCYNCNCAKGFYRKCPHLESVN